MRQQKPVHIRGHIILVLLTIILASTATFSLTLGRFHIPAGTVARILVSSAVPGTVLDDPPWQEEERLVVNIVRLPRIMVVIMAGMGLALSGAAMQGLFRNPLVGPQIIGVSSGASFGGVLAILLSLSPAGIVGLGFTFGLLALIMVFGLSQLAGRAGILSLVLAGVIVSAFYGALVGIIQYMADTDEELPSMVYWLMGSFAGANWEKVVIIGVPTLTAGVTLLLLRWRINLLSLGDTDAAALGVNVTFLRWGVLCLVSLIIAAQVSVSGGVGWVGLVIPHFARMLVGPDHRILLPASGVMGGLYLLIMDCLARNLSDLEIPIGLLTALVGTPVFGFFFWKTRARGWVGD